MKSSWAVTGVVTIASLLTLWSSQCSLGSAREQATRAEMERDSLAADAAAARAAADGWEVKFGVDSPEDLVLLLDSIDRRFAEDLRASNVRVEALAEVVSVLHDSIASVGEVVEVVRVDSVTGAVTGAWEGEIDDDLISGNWRFRLPAAEIRLSLVARCPARLVLSQSGDGRMLIFARGSDPRCAPEISTLR